MPDVNVSYYTFFSIEDFNVVYNAEKIDVFSHTLLTMPPWQQHALSTAKGWPTETSEHLV